MFPAKIRDFACVIGDDCIHDGIEACEEDFFNREPREITRRVEEERFFLQKVTKETKELRTELCFLPSDLYGG
jgi:hypothetical protein